MKAAHSAPGQHPLGPLEALPHHPEAAVARQILALRLTCKLMSIVHYVLSACSSCVLTFAVLSYAIAWDHITIKQAAWDKLVVPLSMEAYGTCLKMCATAMKIFDLECGCYHVVALVVCSACNVVPQIFRVNGEIFSSSA